ncbi:MAG: type I DNA topoisomerase [Candidatus Marinimicrobia bacterium]|jgi:DNA topoisomerase-1|nr:type I DNA topoisomerase [Candidatus Neomarinimicrobiota bacterium]
MASDLHNLIIVESPSKAKTLKRFLGNEYQIEASVGHIRDLPKSDLGVDVDNGFKPTYVASKDKSKVITQLKKLLKNASTLYLATDPDREGEAIAWHLMELLDPKIPVKRLAFHEITKTAIQESFDHIRDIDQSLVSAQEARRILDRLWGYLVSKKLWFNVKGGLSAGRVQSPAVKIVVDREKERARFIESEYWSIIAQLSSNEEFFEARLKVLDGQKIAIGKDFDKETGKLSKSNLLALDKTKAESLTESFLNSDWKVSKVEQKPAKQNPYPPFITSTLQQEGVRKLRMSSQQVMRSAQKLYEEGYITYMRTDSVSLSSEAINGSRNAIESLFGAEYLPETPPIYKSKVKNAQEAHEAIRPAGSTFKNPKDIRGKLDNQEWKLYDMIWKRTLASQMKSAKLLKTTVEISDGKAMFDAHGKVIEFPGFLKVYVEDIDDPKKERDDKESILPPMQEGESVTGKEFTPNQHFTKPSPRFTEATLVKELEALGIGRPSTYAAIMGNIQNRGYARKVNGALIPTFTAYAVVQFLEANFTDMVNLQYTANLENTLDAISRNEMKSEEFLTHFYKGENGTAGLEALLENEVDKEKSRTIMELKDDSDKTITVKIGRYGVYIQDGETNTTLPDDSIPSELNFEHALQSLEKKAEGPTELCNHPDSGEPVLLKDGRFGPYVQCGDKMKSLLPGMTLEEVTSKIALDLIALPKDLGKHPESGDMVKSDIGRYGPYIRCGKNTRSVIAPDSILQLTLERAVEILAMEKAKSGSRVIKELGIDPKTQMAIEIKDGRYGSYVTNGKINATLPKATPSDEITLDIALQLIAEKKAKGPSKRRFKKRK